MDRMDFRYMRAQQLSAAIMDELKDILHPDPDGFFDLRKVHERIFDALYRNGASWTTDKEREAFGFESRDGKGWTPSEQVQFEREKIEAMLALAEHVFIVERNKNGTKQKQIMTVEESPNG